MKINKSYIKIAFGIALISLFYIGCQNMDRPELGNYPKDANAIGGNLKFYVAFDGTTTNSLMNAVDSIRAKFPTDNPLESTDIDMCITLCKQCHKAAHLEVGCKRSDLKCNGVRS